MGSRKWNAGDFPPWYPEMAEALEEIIERADSMAQEVDENSDVHAAFIRIRDDAEAALRKARGEVDK